MQDFKKGDEVKLKSGGPVVTVKDMGEYLGAGVENGVLCVWFVDNELKEKVFDQATLVKHEG